MHPAEMHCACHAFEDVSSYERECDYCGTSWEDRRCSHVLHQPPCPECDVVPVAQAV